MTAPVRHPPVAVRPDPVAVFAARCEARALLWQAGEFGLHEAVDKLQHDAVRDGLFADIGQDAVQAIMATAFAAVRDDLLPGEPDDMVPDDIVLAASLKPARVGLSRSGVGVLPFCGALPFTRSAPWEGHAMPRAAASTVEAVVHALRERGAAALPQQAARLAELSDAQLERVIVRLARKAPNPDSDPLLLALVELLP